MELKFYLTPHKSKPKTKILNVRFKPLKLREKQKMLCEVEFVSDFWILHKITCQKKKKKWAGSLHGNVI